MLTVCRGQTARARWESDAGAPWAWKAILYETHITRPDFTTTAGAEEWSSIVDATGDAPYVSWPAVSPNGAETFETQLGIYIWHWEGELDGVGHHLARAA